MDTGMIIAFLAAVVALGTPILLAAAGEMVAERSGILNLGVEGMMLVGAVTGVIVTLKTGNHWAGISAAMAAGGVVSLIHAFISVTLNGNQVVSGLALTLFGTGLSGFVGMKYVGVPVANPFEPWSIPLLSKIPYLGPVLFHQDSLVYLSYLVVIGLYLMLYKTAWGLSLRAVGEDPAAADATGISVSRTRYLATMIGGMLAGLGGAYLSLAFTPAWMEGMTAGRGWIAVALVIFGMWDPVKILAGSYLFGTVEALNYRFQTLGITVPSFFLQMLPYVLTILAVFLAVRVKGKEAGPPAALSTPYDRESR